METENKFTKENTLAVKGIAIFFLLTYHCLSISPALYFLCWCNCSFGKQRIWRWDFQRYSGWCYGYLMCQSFVWNNETDHYLVVSESGSVIDRFSSAGTEASQEV